MTLVERLNRAYQETLRIREAFATIPETDFESNCDALASACSQVADLTPLVIEEIRRLNQRITDLEANR